MDKKGAELARKEEARIADKLYKWIIIAVVTSAVVFIALGNMSYKGKKVLPPPTDNEKVEQVQDPLSN